MTRSAEQGHLSGADFDIFYDLLTREKPTRASERALSLRSQIVFDLWNDELIGAICENTTVSNQIMLLAPGLRLISDNEHTHLSRFSERTRDGKLLIPYVNHFIRNRYGYRDSELRFLFNIIEFSLNVVYNVALRDFAEVQNDSIAVPVDYVLKTLWPHQLVEPRIVELGFRIRNTRNEFCHSVKDGSDISYCGRPLSYSFNRLSPHRGSRKRKCLFLDDAFEFTSALAKIIIQNQHKQFSIVKLASILAGDRPLVSHERSIVMSFVDHEMTDTSRCQQGLPNL